MRLARTLLGVVLAVVALVALLLPGVATAAPAAPVVGTVTDASGAPVVDPSTGTVTVHADDGQTYHLPATLGAPPATAPTSGKVAAAAPYVASNSFSGINAKGLTGATQCVMRYTQPATIPGTNRGGNLITWCGWSGTATAGNRVFAQVGTYQCGTCSADPENFPIFAFEWITTFTDGRAVYYDGRLVTNGHQIQAVQSNNGSTATGFTVKDVTAGTTHLNRVETLAQAKYWGAATTTSWLLERSCAPGADGVCQPSEYYPLPSWASGGFKYTANATRSDGVKLDASGWTPELVVMTTDGSRPSSIAACGGKIVVLPTGGAAAGDGRFYWCRSV